MNLKSLDAWNYPIPRPVHAFIRLSLATIWIYEGLYLKVLVRNPHELRIVSSAVGRLHVPGQPVMTVIGLLETGLGLLLCFNLFTKPLAGFQVLLLLGMNGLGILFGGGEIADPFYLITHNMPTFACIVTLLACVPVERLET